MQHTPPYNLDHVPFLRLLIPLIIGIAWQYIAPSTLALCVVCGIAVACGIVAWALRKEQFAIMRKGAFSGCVFSIFVVIGMAVCLANTPATNIPHFNADTIAVARIESTPIEQEHSYRLWATIVAINDSNTTRDTHIKTELNIQKSYTASTLQGGEHILFHPALQRIASRDIPYAFDYAQYMAQKGILYRQYLSDGTWQLSQYQAPLSLRHRAMRLQRQCVDNLYRCNLSPDNASLLAALLWGYKADISQSIRSNFASAGLSHILAVSGMHTGIIALVLWLLLYPLRYTPLRPLQNVATIVLLWTYAFVTGLSPSVIRACIMATFVGTASLLNRENTSLNALLGSAVMVLLIAPMQLFDIGFQLSYTAVAGIITLAPHLNLANYTASQHPIVRYITGLLAASLAAQIATIPLAAHYFHYIAVWGLISNMLLTPLLTPLVFMTLAMQLSEAIHLPFAWLHTATDYTATLLTQGADAIGALPGATIEGVWVSLPILLLYGIIIGAMWYSISRRTIRPITTILAAIIGIQVLVLHNSMQPSEPMALLTTENNHTYLQLADDDRNCLIVGSNDTISIPAIGSQWRTHEHLTTQRVSKGDTLSTQHIYVAIPFIKYYNHQILWVDDNTWRYSHSPHRRHIDYAIITEKYTGRIAHLLNNFNIDNIILSSSIYPTKSQELKQECLHNDITCHDARNAGTWIVTPQ